MQRKSYGIGSKEAGSGSKKTWRDRLPKFEKPEKVTGAELEAKFDNWSAEKRSALAARTPEQNGRAFRRGLCIALALCLSGMAVFTSLSTNAREATIRDQGRQVDALSKQLDELTDNAGTATDDEDEEPVTADSLMALNKRAVTKAEKVADGQNAYADLAVKTNKAITSGEGNGAPSDEMLDMVDHRTELADDWDPSSFIVSDEDVEIFTTAELYDVAKKIDPRFPWYIRYDGAVATDAKDYSWHVESVQPSIEEPGEASTIWVSKDGEGTVLAWASAVYDDERGTFDGLELVVSAEGMKHARTGTADKEPAVPELEGKK